MKTFRGMPGAVVTVVSLGCGPAAVVSAPPPAKPAPAAPAKAVATPPEVFFPQAAFAKIHTVDLGGGTALQIGDTGRRALAKGTVVEEGPPLPEQIVAALSLGAEGIALTGRSGLTYIVKEPLGPIVESRGGPSESEPPQQITAGKGAIVFATRTAVHRSIDGAHTWQKLPISPARPGTFQKVLLSKSGEGLLVKVPQQVFATKDDGATWSEIDSTGIGATHLSMETSAGVEQLWLHGTLGASRLAGGKLTFEKPASKPDPKDSPGSAPWYAWRLAGAFVVVDEHGGAWRMQIGRLGEALGETPKPCGSPNVGGDAHSVWAACSEPVELHRWTPEHGWKLLLKPGGRIEYTELAIAVNGGAVWVGRNCDGEDCGPRKVSYDQTTFADVKLAAKGDVRAVAFDAKTHRGYVLAEDDGRLAIYASEPSSPTFVRTKWLDVEAQRFLPNVQATVDDEGVLRVGVCLASYDGCALHAFRNGAPEPTRYLGVTNGLVLAVKHGIWEQGGGLVYETADGGAHWSLVSLPISMPTNFTPDLACNEFGCLRGRTARLGWGLPTPAIVEVEADKTSKFFDPAPAATVSATPGTKQITCKPSGPAIAAVAPKETKELIEMREGFAWIDVTKDGVVVEKIAAGGKVSQVELFPKQKTKNEKGVLGRIIDGVAVRLAWKDKPDSKVAPEVDVAFLPTGKTSGPVRARLPAIPPFQPKERDVALSRVSGGIVVRVGTKVFFVDEKAHANELTDVEPLDMFARIGKGFVSARVQDGVIDLAWSGAPITHATWNIADSGRDGLGRLFATSEGVFASTIVNDQVHFLRVPDTRASDPKETLSGSARELAKALPGSICTEPLSGPAALGGSDELADGPRWQITIDTIPAALGEVTLSTRLQGKAACASTLMAGSEDHRVRIPLATPQHAWLLESDTLRPLECKL